MNGGSGGDGGGSMDGGGNGGGGDSGNGGGDMPPPPITEVPGITSGEVVISVSVTMSHSLAGATIYYRAASDTTTDLSVAIDPNDNTTYTGMGTTASPAAFSSPGHVYRIKAVAVATDGRLSPETAIQRFDYGIDGDNDGLIEIRSLTMLHNMRYSLNGSGYKSDASATPITAGCPGNTCTGYELVSDLSFDTDGDGTWNTATYALDMDDNQAPYFVVANGGWEPIGTSGTNRTFTATFDGNGYTITGLAIQRNQNIIGFFGETTNASIRNIGLIDNLADYTGSGTGNVIGGLIGRKNGGSIVASYTTGPARGGGGNGDNVGGLVGEILLNLTNIVASYATGDADGGGGNTDYVGGLIGSYNEGNVIASYATGDANGGAGTGDRVGALIGNTHTINMVASYATGAANSGADTNDLAGALIGRRVGSTITASFGLGSATGTTTNMLGTAIVDRTGPPAWVDGTSDATDLTLGIVNEPDGDTTTDAGDENRWNSAGDDTLGAWNFGNTSQAPALQYADYDGTGGNDYHCASDTNPAPTGAIIIANCGTLIPNQPGR